MRNSAVWMILLGFLISGCAHADDTLNIRGKPQTLHLYGARGGKPVILASGDAGWHSLAPVLAESLAEQGYFVVGLDSKSYLESFTTANSHLAMGDVPKDFAELVDFASKGSTEKPVLIGASEGAGLCALAATDPALKAKIAGVLALGLPDQNELGWRTRDFVIWFTKKIPNEPTFSVKDIIHQISPVPLAGIHSTQDEFISVEDEQKMFLLAGEPKKLWVLEAKNHSFKDKRPELEKTVTEALAWIRQKSSGS